MKIKHLNKLKSTLEKISKKHPETASDAQDIIVLMDELIALKSNPRKERKNIG